MLAKAAGPGIIPAEAGGDSPQVSLAASNALKPTEPPQPASSAYMPRSFADIADKLLPAVVNISTTETVQPGSNSDEDDGNGEGGDEGDPNNTMPEMPKFPPGSPFEKFFHDFMNRQRNGGGAPAPRRMQALGSGFIIDPSGIVVTNNHVVRHADQITVTLQDNTALTAKLIGHDDRTDLAILKIEPKTKLAAVAFGNSDTARIGDWVVAIGNPFGLAGSVTAGIVSSRGRNIEQGPYDDFIQTDAPINKGNSGGPLFNLKGEVIGINTAIFSPSGGSIGIGFAIPSNEARAIVEQLRKNGKVLRGWIGVRIQPVNQDIADSLGLPSAQGALVAGVEPKGPAEKAHLQSGDVLLTLDGKPIEARFLPRMVADVPVGRVIKLGVWRQGKKLTLPLTIAALPEEPAQASSAQQPKKEKGHKPNSTNIGALGFFVSEITPPLRQKFSLPDSAKGVVVTQIGENSPVADRDLRVGDVILQVQQDKVTTVTELSHAIEQAKKQNRKFVLLLVQSGDSTHWVPVPLGK
ncbi:DegQ family serine endoprotease [Entomobacter blattae]